MYCNYCGKVIQDDANVCAYCGVRVGGVAARTRLVRPREGRKIAGVCAGLAEYFDLDVTLIRMVWLIVVIFGIVFLYARRQERRMQTSSSEHAASDLFDEEDSA